MFTWLRRLLSSPAGEGTPEQTLDLQRRVRELQLALQERDGQIARLQGDLERQRKEEAAVRDAHLRAEGEKLLTDAAGPISQLWTQVYLLEVEGKPVQARDVQAVAKRLVRVLEDRGLVLLESVGSVVAFDPNRHTPLAGESPAPGTPVRVRFVGASLAGKVLRKAGVEVADAGTTGR